MDVILFPTPHFIQFPHTKVIVSLVYGSCQTTILGPLLPNQVAASALTHPPDAIPRCLRQGTSSCQTKMYLNILQRSNRWNSSTQNWSTGLFWNGSSLCWLSLPQHPLTFTGLFLEAGITRMSSSQQVALCINYGLHWSHT